MSFQLKGKRGEAASMALLVVGMALITDLGTGGWIDWMSFAVLLLALGRIIWIFPADGDTRS